MEKIVYTTKRLSELEEHGFNDSEQINEKKLTFKVDSQRKVRHWHIVLNGYLGFYLSELQGEKRLIGATIDKKLFFNYLYENFNSVSEFMDYMEEIQRKSSLQFSFRSLGDEGEDNNE